MPMCQKSKKENLLFIFLKKAPKSIEIIFESAAYLNSCKKRKNKKKIIKVDLMAHFIIHQKFSKKRMFILFQNFDEKLSYN